MYHDHFGLERAPFRITPDTELFYPGGGRGEVLEALVYAVTSGEGIVKVTGEVGTGKTMLCRMLEVRLPNSVEVVYIANPSLSPEDILHAIALEMNLPVEASAGRLQVMHALQHRLLDMHSRNRRVVVFVEEAQGMPLATLEEIRLLSNLETQRDKLLQIVLFGQPELDQTLDRANIRQLRERITHSFRLEPLSRDEVREYVRFRMRSVGYRGPDVFKEGAYRLLARASEGLVRRINILADKALLAAFADDIHNVTSRHMRVAIEDGSFERRSQARAWWLGGVAALLFVAVGTLFALDHLPWQRWLRHYGLGDSALLQGNAGSGLSTRPVAAEAVLAPVAAELAPENPVRAAPASSPPLVPSSPVAAAVAATTSVAETPARAGSMVIENAPASTVAPDTAAAAPLGDGIAGVSPASPVSAPTPAAAEADPAPTVQALTTPASVAAPTEATGGTTTLSAPAVVAVAAVADVTTRAAAAVPSAAQVGSPPVAATKAPVDSTAVVAEASSGLAIASAETAPAVQTVGSAREAPAPATPKGSARGHNRLLTERVAATAEWLRTARAGSFCIQLLLADVGRQDSLEEFLRRMQVINAYERIYVYETVIGARGWFGVLYGEFDSFDKARSALEALPEELKRHKPFIRNVRDIVGQG